MTDRPGVDYSYGRPGGKALAAAGMHFAARYLSHTDEKNLDRAEANDLAAHGVSCVVVWETTAQRASAGRNAGVEDAREAAAQAKACGMPSTRPVYFAVDYDAAPSAVVSYFQGVASVLGLSRTGVYAGYKVVDYLLDHHLATWAWQTVAWSGGRWDARAHIRQYASTVRINGVSCDRDTAMTADYGQWTPGKTPATSKETNDMPLTSADLDLLAKQDGHFPAPRDAADYSDDPKSKGHWWSLGTHQQSQTETGRATLREVQEIRKLLAAQGAAITALAQQLGKGADVTTIVSAVREAVADATVHVSVDVTGADDAEQPAGTPVPAAD